MSVASLDRSDLVEKAAGLVQRGDVNAAIPYYVRLFQDNPTDWNVANTLGDLYVRVGNSDDAVAHFAGLAERLATDGFIAKARALYRKILRIQPNNGAAKQRVEELDKQGGAASPFLQRVLETARTAREHRPAESEAEERTAVDVPAPEPVAAEAAPPEPEPVVAPPPVPRLRLVETEVVIPITKAGLAPPELQVPDEFTEVEIAAESASRRHDFTGALGTVERFLASHPRHIGALEKLIDIGVDGRLDAELTWAQVRLAEACLDTGRYEQAQDIAIDLIFREPGATRHQDLLDRITAAAREHNQRLRPPPILEREAMEPSVAVAPAPVVTPPAIEMRVLEPAPRAPVISPHAQVDPEPEAAVHPDLREWSDPGQAFEDIRTMLLEEAAAAAEERMAEAARFAEAGHFDQAVRALEEAMCAPHLRTRAGARLAGIHRDLGSPIEALSCLEWVAEMPPPSEESGHELAYQLALTLESLGQQAQALGVYRELLAEVGPAYRDVATRAERLAAA